MGRASALLLTRGMHMQNIDNFKIGDSVKVKPNVKDPDFQIPMVCKSLSMSEQNTLLPCCSKEKCGVEGKCFVSFRG